MPPTSHYRLPLMVLLAITLGGCSDAPAESSPTRPAAPRSEAATTEAVAQPSAEPSSATGQVAARPQLPRGDDPVKLYPADFTTKIDNPYSPMAPRTRWTYREIDEEGKQLKVVVIVTNQTKEIANGITARVVRDTVTEAGELVEDTFDWYAQDNDGNVWYLGEDTAEFENGKIATKSGSWEAGVDGALAGIIMPGDPRAGLRYRQEYYKGEAEDNGGVLSTREMADVPAGHYDNVLLTKDTNAIEPNVLEYKLYAKGVGPVLALGISGGVGREELLNVDRAPSTAGTGPLGTPDS
ncbi:hypothetical protein BH24ACT14_BH24ACT14_08030 [soil metagenome]